MLENTAYNWKQGFYEKGEAMGIAKGEAMGRASAIRELIENALARRFGTVPEDIRCALENISGQASLNELASHAFTAGNIEEFREALPR